MRSERRRSGAFRRATRLVLLFFTIIFVGLFFQSPVSKVGRIDVVGARWTDPADIRRASGVSEGDFFFGFRARAAENRIASSFPSVREVRVIRRFPGEVRIVVDEYPKVAYEIKEDGTLMAVLENAASVPAGNEVPDRPILTGWERAPELKRRLCERLARIPSGLLADFSEIRPDPLPFFEDRIRIYTRSRYEVLARIEDLHEKIALLNEMIHRQSELDRQQNRERRGIFSIVGDQAYFSPEEPASVQAQ